MFARLTRSTALLCSPAATATLSLTGRNGFAASARMGKPKILLLGPLNYAQDTWNGLSEVAELVDNTASSRAEFLKDCKDGKLDGVVAAFRTFASFAATGQWDQELVDALPDSFKLVAHNGAGYDQLVPEALLSRSILATNVPTAVDDSTADTAVFLLLGAMRNFNISMHGLRQHEWKGKPLPAKGHDPQGKVLGILGMGGIGRNLATKCRAFGMKIQYHNRRKIEDLEQAANAKYVSFDELLATSDVISLNLPLNPHTRHIISTKEFAKMKKGVVIVNTARGAVIDEAALVKALDDGIVGSAGLDVFENEPEVHEGLVRNNHVMLLPHMGTWSIETETSMEQWSIGNIRQFLKWQAGDGTALDNVSAISEHRELWNKLKEGS